MLLRDFSSLWLIGEAQWPTWWCERWISTPKVRLGEVMSHNEKMLMVVRQWFMWCIGMSVQCRCGLLMVVRQWCIGMNVQCRCGLLVVVRQWFMWCVGMSVQCQSGLVLGTLTTETTSMLACRTAWCWCLTCVTCLSPPWLWTRTPPGHGRQSSRCNICQERQATQSGCDSESSYSLLAHLLVLLLMWGL